MINFLKIEYLKIKGNTSFRVFTLFFVILLPIIVLLSPMVFTDSVLGQDTYPYIPKSSSTSWYFTTIVASWFSIFVLSFIIIFHITNEYSAKTVRQNIIDGYTKLDFLKSKIYMVVFMAIVATIYVFLVGLVANLFFSTNQPDLSDVPYIPGISTQVSGDFSNLFDGLIFILSYFIQILAYFIMAVFVSFVVRKGALVVMVYFGLFFVETIIGAQLNQSLKFIVPYLPFHSFSSLLPNPDLQSLLLGVGDVERLTLVNAIVSICYIFLIIFITKIIFYKRDVV